MVRFERKKSRKTDLAEEALVKAKAAGSTYNTPEVVDALQEVFHGKCYICESKGIEAIEIEHLRPHKEDPALKYDWLNLYLSCRHCNNTKSGRYDPILDCCTQDIDRLIAFRKAGYFGEDEKLTFTPLNDNVQINNTCQLLYDVYYGKTPQKAMESKILRRKVRVEMSSFKEKIREYYEEDGEEKEDLRVLIVRELRNSSPFTAFKRWLLRDNIERYSDFREYL